MRVRARARLYAVLAAAAFALSACARDDFPQNTLAPQGPQAEKIDRLFQPVFWIAVAVFFLVEGAMVYFLVRYRHRPGRGVPAQVHGNKRLEVTWTVIPAVLLAVIAVPTLWTIFALAEKPANALEITVTGHQWWWEVRYPAQASKGVAKEMVTANEVRIPTGIPVYISLISGPSGAAGGPVIHSFWIPRLAGKQDVVPGRTNHLTIEAPNPGTYLGQCAEFCGISHANMRLRLVAQPPSEFEAWVQQQAQPAAQPPPDVLAIMDRVGCGGCHTINGVKGQGGVPYAGIVGPDLSHFADRSTFAGAILDITPANLADWLRDPQAVKPGNDMTIGPGGQPGRSVLSEDEINALVQYLGSLR
ncbi:MAG TPA: cytochrome c oxidase subunit II [Actinomycetota bacterium]